MPDGRLPQAGHGRGALLHGLRYLVLPILWEGDALGRIVFGPFTPDDMKDFRRR